MAAKTFTVIAGDLVGSRDSLGREDASRKIPAVIDRVCTEFRSEFYAPLVLTRGIDEVSGVLKRPNMAYRICRLVNDGVSPRLLRFALVRGPLDIAISSRDARRMDGPAFHMAADMIGRAKRYNLYYSFKLGYETQELDSCLTELANLLQILRSDWSDHQLRVARLYEKLGSQNAVAGKLGITQQGVSDSLRQGHWKELKRAEDLISHVLAKHCSHL